MSDEPIWEVPPLPLANRSGRGGRLENPAVRHMKDNPGRWLVYLEQGSSSTVGYLRKKGFDATSRATGDNPSKRRIYARWPAVSDAE